MPVVPVASGIGPEVIAVDLGEPVSGAAAHLDLRHVRPAPGRRPLPGRDDTHMWHLAVNGHRRLRRVMSRAAVAGAPGKAAQ